MIETLTWQQVPGWFDFDDVYQAAVDRAPPAGAHFVEVGVLCGRSALFMAEAIHRSKKQIAFDAVDPFALSLEAIRHIVKTYPATCPGGPEPGNPLFDTKPPSSDPDVVPHILELSGLGNLVNLVRARGQLWAQNYPAESLDFVYVDAKHTYEDTEQILRAFAPKIRPGGVLGGHDYDLPDVRRAVQDVLGTKIETYQYSFVWTK